MLNNEIRERELKRIKNILRRGLKKEFLLPVNKNYISGVENEVKVKVCKFRYETDELAKVILDIVERLGNEVSLSAGQQVENRSIYLGEFKYNVSSSPQSEDYREENGYRYFVYPESVNNFLNDIEGKKSSLIFDNNSILVGFNDNDNDNNIINFDNSFNVDLNSLSEYVVIKYLFGIIIIDYVRDYDKEFNERELAINNFMCNSLNIGTSLNDLVIYKNVINKIVNKEKKCKTRKLV